MASDGGKGFVVVLGLLGLGALVYFLVKSNDQPAPAMAPQTRWLPVPRTQEPAAVQEETPQPEYNSRPQEPKVLYQNEERITLIRDAEGHIAEFVVHRRVTADG